MAYRQIVWPNLDTSAIAGMCLMYVDDAIGARDRNYSAQISFERSVGNGWVHPNIDYPRSVWFVMYWSIDNGPYAGYGHVALAHVDDYGSMQIHDSEVHRGARGAYRSQSEIFSWFGSVGTRLTFLGWSEGCDGTKIIQNIEEEEAYNRQVIAAIEAESKRKQQEIERIQEEKRLAEEKARQEEEKRKQESQMTVECITRIKDDGFKDPFVKDSVWYWSVATGFINLKTRYDFERLDSMNMHITGKQICRMPSSKNEPVHLRLKTINGKVNVDKAESCVMDNIPTASE